MKPWQYRPTPPPQAITAAELPNTSREVELLHRYHLHFMDARVYARLEALFTDPPVDMTARLKKACDHLGVTGEHAELFATAAEYQDALEQLTARVGAGAWPVGNLETLKDYLGRVRRGDASALRSVLTYITQEAVKRELSRST